MRYVSLFVLLFVTSNVMAQIIEDKEPAILEVQGTRHFGSTLYENLGSGHVGKPELYRPYDFEGW